jgi:uncharacterized protein (PEP-CTERM system associated)
MLSGRRRHILQAGSAAAALAAAMSWVAPSYGQDAPVSLAQVTPAQASAPVTAPASNQAARQARAGGDLSTFADSLIPGFTLNARVNLAEIYTTNSYGSSAAGGNQDDYLTTAGLNLDLHDHSRRVSFDAFYYGQIYYYAKSATQTQFTNDLSAMATVMVIPDYVNFIGRAFAQPVVLSNSGFATASGIVSPNGYNDSYGYSVGPEAMFRLGSFASSDMLATYGAAYFQTPTGYNAIAIPGVAGPEDITSRNVVETLKSGEDFARLNWSLVGQLSETDRRQGLFSEKVGIGNLRYAISQEISLLGTGGYDSLHNTIPLSRNLSGPVALGGFELVFGPDFDLMAEAGRKYNSFSFLGSLRWNVGARSTVTGLATDNVSTPEGQLLNNLGSMTASLNGNLTTPANIYSDGTASTLSSFTAQSLGSLSFTQIIARYQRISLTYSLDYERDHGNVTLFGEKLSQLEVAFFGPPTTTSWGGQASYSHNITRDLTGLIGAGYSYYQELGGHSKNFNFSGQVDYTLGPRTNIYFRTEFFKRDSSTFLQNLSPYTGSLDDFRLTLGLYRQL